MSNNKLAKTHSVDSLKVLEGSVASKDSKMHSGKVTNKVVGRHLETSSKNLKSSLEEAAASRGDHRLPLRREKTSYSRLR